MLSSRSASYFGLSVFSQKGNHVRLYAHTSPVIPFNPLKISNKLGLLKFSPNGNIRIIYFFSKVNLGKAYKLAIFIFLGKVLIPSNPFNPLKKVQNLGFLLFFRLVHRNYPMFGTKVILGNTYTLEIFKFFEKF